MRKTAIATASLIAGAVLLTGCGSSAGGVDYGTDTSTTVNSHEKLNVEGSDDTQIYDVTLRDGTHCIISDGAKSGGIACDFQ